jgi:hypothetical protein
VTGSEAPPSSPLPPPQLVFAGRPAIDGIDHFFSTAVNRRRPSSSGLPDLQFVFTVSFRSSWTFSRPLPHSGSLRHRDPSSAAALPRRRRRSGDLIAAAPPPEVRPQRAEASGAAPEAQLPLDRAELAQPEELRR